MRKIGLIFITVFICLTLTNCANNVNELHTNKLGSTTSAVTSISASSNENKVGPFVYDGKDYYRVVFDYTNKQLKIYTGKDKSNEKAAFNFSDSTFFCGSPCYNNTLYYVFSDTETKTTTVYNIEDGKLLKVFSIKGIGCQSLQCEIINGCLYYSTETDLYKIDLNGKNQKLICSSNGTEKLGHMQFKFQNSLIYIVDDDGIYSISALGGDKTKIVSKKNIDYFVVDSENIVYSSENNIYVYNSNTKSTNHFYAENMNLRFNLYNDKIYYSVNEKSDDVTFELHSCNLDGTSDKTIYTSPKLSWYNDIYFNDNTLYCAYFTEPSEINEVLVSMNLDGSKQTKIS